MINPSTVLPFQCVHEAKQGVFNQLLQSYAAGQRLLAKAKLDLEAQATKLAELTGILRLFSIPFSAAVSLILTPLWS